MGIVPNYSLFTNRLTHCPHPKSLSQVWRGTLRDVQIISEQAVNHYGNSNQLNYYGNTQKPGF
uniref:Uncharacterized protein n=1 Tax=Planktothricoides sp. SpSt-374 TaxID=2282167 RepID=A0A7C3ZTR1_9CYAN